MTYRVLFSVRSMFTPLSFSFSLLQLARIQTHTQCTREANTFCFTLPRSSYFYFFFSHLLSLFSTPETSIASFAHWRLSIKLTYGTRQSLLSSTFTHVRSIVSIHMETPLHLKYSLHSTWVNYNSYVKKTNLSSYLFCHMQIHSQKYSHFTCVWKVPILLMYHLLTIRMYRDTQKSKKEQVKVKQERKFSEEKKSRPRWRRKKIPPEESVV